MMFNDFCVAAGFPEVSVEVNGDFQKANVLSPTVSFNRESIHESLNQVVCRHEFTVFFSTASCSWIFAGFSFSTMQSCAT